MSTGASKGKRSAPSLPDWSRNPARAVLSPTDAQVRGAVLLVPIALLSLGPHLALWGLPNPPFPTDPIAAVLFVTAFAVGTALHELLHGLGHTWGEATWDDIQFGMHWGALTPFAQCQIPSRARSYRLAVALPGLVLGLLPLAVGLWTGTWLASFYGFLMLVAAAGDILVLWILRGVPAGAWVQDHPREVGCLVVAGPEADAPASVSEAELTEEHMAEQHGLSFHRILLLVVVSTVFATVGFFIALA